MIKWIGEHIWDFVSRFRNSVIVEGSNKLYFNDAGGEYISGDGTDLTITSGGELKIQTDTAVAAGSGVSDAASITTYVAEVNGIITTTILVDIQGLESPDADKDIIGDDVAGRHTNAYLTKITTAKNGLIFRADMSCIETPTGTNISDDIDLWANTSNTLEVGATIDTGTRVRLIQTNENWEIGARENSTDALEMSSGLADYYIYLANGESSSATGEYTAGKFIIQLYGANF
jgi:hypothetical protein